MEKVAALFKIAPLMVVAVILLSGSAFANVYLCPDGKGGEVMTNIKKSEECDLLLRDKHESNKTEKVEQPESDKAENTNLPDCKANSRCLLDLSENWETITPADVQAMIDSGADVNAKNNNGLTPLHEAAYRGNAEVIPVLVKAGADVNAKNNNGLTPLHEAAYRGNAEVISVLIKVEADVNAKAKYDWTPLHSAAWKGHTKVIPVLVKAGADVNAKTIDGHTPLHLAAQEGNDQVIPVFVKAGADVNAKDNDGLTPLHDAAIRGKAEVIPVLVKAGADVNAKNNDGWTPLHLAANVGHAEVIPVLIKHGAYIQATDDNGRTPLDLAREEKQWNVVKILEGGLILASPSCFNIIRSKPEQVVWVNGVPTKLLIDTGASITALSYQQARAAGVRITGEAKFTLADESVVVNKTGSANISLGGGLSGKFPISIGKGKGLLGRDVLDEFACR